MTLCVLKEDKSNFSIKEQPANKYCIHSTSLVQNEEKSTSFKEEQFLKRLEILYG